MDPDGSNVAQLTFNTTYDDFPDWSPDGSRIAFMSQLPNGEIDIAVMGADGSNIESLTTNGHNEVYPAWSPNGDRIAYVSDEYLNSEVHVMDADGTNQVRLTTHTAVDGDPVWSSDGSAIAFATTRSGNIDIWVMSPTGAGQTALTTNGAVDTQPDWKGEATTSGNVSAEVSVPTSAACIELSTTAVDFGTQLLGAENQPATPQVIVTNCSGNAETLYARGTDATGVAAGWALVDTVETCSASLGIDQYRLNLNAPELAAPVRLSTSNKQVVTLEAGAFSTQGLAIFMACPGSTGAGQTMGMSLNYLVTE
jgi:dipeptidyl aminopeptidase/acylaminoacyl peptidase